MSYLGDNKINQMHEIMTFHILKIIFTLQIILDHRLNDFPH